MSWQRGQGNGLASSPLMGMQVASSFAKASEDVARMMMEKITVPADIEWGAFQEGVRRFQAASPFAKASGDKGRGYTEVAKIGRVTLLDAGGPGPVVVLVPSMINRGYVLDLCAGHSVVEHLVGAGYRVLVVDWGVPEVGAVVGLEGVIAAHLVPLLRRAAEVNGGPVSVFGYCMGGVLSLAAAVLAGEKIVGKLALGAVPWDFAPTVSAVYMQATRALVEPWLGQAQGAHQVIPAEAMNAYFWSLDPWSGVRRLMAYGRETDPAKLAHMTALETWLHDGLPLDGPVARDMLISWYADNAPMKGLWRVGGAVITPAKLNIPLWVAVPQRDNLVPAASSLAVVAQAKGATVVSVDTGHVGLVCGRRAKELFYEPVTAWLGKS